MFVAQLHGARLPWAGARLSITAAGSETRVDPAVRVRGAAGAALRHPPGSEIQNSAWTGFGLRIKLGILESEREARMFGLDRHFAASL